MKKFLVFLLINISFAGIINGISIIVNDEIITMYDIEKLVEKGIDKKKAVEMLIDKKLFDIVLKKQNISVDIFEIDTFLEKLAKERGLSLSSFKSILKQQYMDNYQDFIDSIKEKIKKDKLIKKLLKGKIKIATDNDLKIFYDSNQDIFKEYKEVEVIEYVSKNKKLLINKTKNPLLQIPNTKEVKVNLNSNINPKIKYLLSTTKENNFTPILTGRNFYVMFFIKAKKNPYIIPFNQVKNKIFNIIMKQREDIYLKEYFAKLKKKVEIKVLR